MNNDYNYEALIPEKFTIGLNNKSVGFPSMKDFDGKWTNVSFFERHCGYKPSTQRDAKKEINKLLTQNVQEIDNVPTSGFELVGLCKYVYSNTDLYKDTNCVILKDPRGWTIQIAIENFKVMLESNGMNLKNGVLEDVEVMYGWPTRSYGPFSLYVVTDKIKKMKEATCKLFAKKTQVEYVKPSQFEVGKIYSAKNTKMGDGSKYDSMYMYLGVHAVYSDRCQFRAVMKKSYIDYDEFVKDRTDISNPERHIFYCLNPKYPVVPISSGIYNNYPSAAPYYVATTLSKLFETVEDVDPAKFKLYSDKTKPATLENIKADMAFCSYFNRIDFAKSKYPVDVEYQLLEDFYGYMNGYDKPLNIYMASFPFYPMTDGIFLNSAVRNNIAITSYRAERNEPGRYVLKDARMRNDYSGSYWNRENIYKTYQYEFETPDSKRIAFKQLYNDLRPTVLQYVFRNSNKVPAYQNLILNTRTYFDDIDD